MLLLTSLPSLIDGVNSLLGLCELLGHFLSLQVGIDVHEDIVGSGSDVRG